MKLSCIYFILFIVGLQTCDTRGLPEPIISNHYSNVEIDQIIDGYDKSKSSSFSPSAILIKRFLLEFPGAHDIDWEQSEDIYIVDFEVGTTDYEAYYDKDANLLMYLFEIKKTELPSVVLNAAIARYPDSKLKGCKKIVKGSLIYYRTELKKDNFRVKLVLRKDGCIIDEIRIS